MKNQTFEFMYNDTWYRYECGYIYRQNCFGDYGKLVPVMRELNEQLVGYSLDQKQLIMGAIIHGFTHGKFAGADDKTREIKRVLNID